MSRYELGWGDVALDQYVALSPEHQHLIDSRLSQLLYHPDDADCSHDEATDHWTTTDSAGIGLIVYIFRIGRPRLVVLRLVYYSQTAPRTGEAELEVLELRSATTLCEPTAPVTLSPPKSARETRDRTDEPRNSSSSPLLRARVSLLASPPPLAAALLSSVLCASRRCCVVAALTVVGHGSCSVRLGPEPLPDEHYEFLAAEGLSKRGGALLPVQNAGTARDKTRV